MAIYISNCHIYVQFVDDVAQKTLAQVTTLGAGVKVNVESAKAIGEKAAAAATAKGIAKVVVDRGGFRFHGRVKAIVDAAMAAGIRISDKPPKVREEKVEEAKEAKKPSSKEKKEAKDAGAKDASKAKPKKEKA